jgi:hypothetical protein
MKKASRKWLATISLALLCAAAAPWDTSRAAPRPQDDPVARAVLAESEPNDSAATADPASTGDLFNGAIASGADVDYVSITVPAGTHIIAQLRVDDATDLQLSVIGSNGTSVLKTDDDAEPGQAWSQLTWIFDLTGTYYLRVEGSSGGTGSYTLSIQLSSDGQFILESEPNSLPGTADPIVVGQPVRGSIGLGDFDYYSFSAPAGSRVYAYAQTEGSTFGNDQPGEDSQLLLLDAMGGQIEADDNAGPGFSSLITGAVVPSTGTYLLRVSHATQGSSINPYVLHTAFFTAVRPEVESNNSPAFANPGEGLNSGSIVNFGQTPDLDYYSFTASVGDSVFIALDNDPENDAASDPLNAEISLIGPDGATRLLVSDFSLDGQEGDEVIVYSPRVSGTHYVEVRDVNGQGGATFTYHLAINRTAGGAGPANDSVGLYTPGTAAFFLKNVNTPGPADAAFVFGAASPNFRAVDGDWNGDGVDTIGLYDVATGTFFLKNSNGPGGADAIFRFGPANAVFLPVAGDWNGDGLDTIGVYSPVTGVFFLRNTNTPGPADATFRFGPANAGFLPIAGDWNGDNFDTIGVYSPLTGTFFLRNANTPGPANTTFRFGPANAGFRPIAGDWNSDGFDTIGVYNPATGTFFLKNSNAPGPADTTFRFGTGNAQPLAGDWDGV